MSFDPIVLTPSGSTSINVEFDSASSGPFTGSVTITSDDPDDNPFIFAIELQSPPPDIAVSFVHPDATITELTDGDTIDIDSPDSWLEFDIRNDAVDGDLNISAVTVGGQISSATLDTTIVSPGSSALLTVDFDVTSAGPYMAWVEISSNDPDEEPFAFNINLSDSTDSNGPAFNQSSYYGDVVEGVISGTVVANVGDVTNPSGDPLTYAITDGDPTGKFAIDSDGVVTVIGTIDSESQSTYELEVQVSSLVGSSTATLDVTVGNITPSVVVDASFFVFDIVTAYLFVDLDTGSLSGFTAELTLEGDYDSVALSDSGGMPIETGTEFPIDQLPDEILVEGVEAGNFGIKLQVKNESGDDIENMVALALVKDKITKKEIVLDGDNKATVRYYNCSAAVKAWTDHALLRMYRGIAELEGKLSNVKVLVTGEGEYEPVYRKEKPTLQEQAQHDKDIMESVFGELTVAQINTLLTRLDGIRTQFEAGSLVIKCVNKAGNDLVVPRNADGSPKDYMEIRLPKFTAWIIDSTANQTVEEMNILYRSLAGRLFHEISHMFGGTIDEVGGITYEVKLQEDGTYKYYRITFDGNGNPVFTEVAKPAAAILLQSAEANEEWFKRYVILENADWDGELSGDD